MRRAKRGRRTSADMAVLRDGLVTIVTDDQPMTVRQVYYRATDAGLVLKDDKTSKGKHYKTVMRLLLELRKNETIPWEWIADGTRSTMRPTVWSSLHQAAASWHRYYRRALWDMQSVRVQIWLEKRALAEALWPVTSEYDVPLNVVAGYSSHAFIRDCALELVDYDQPTVVLYVGDFNPSGLDLERFASETFVHHAPAGADIRWMRIALTLEQIEQLNLSTCEPNIDDPRTGSWKSGDPCCDVDAIKPSALRQLVRDAIELHVDQVALKRTHAAEARDKRQLAGLLSKVNKKAGR